MANCAFFLLFFFRTLSLHCLAPPPNSKIAISQKLSPLTHLKTLGFSKNGIRKLRLEKVYTWLSGDCLKVKGLLYKIVRLPLQKNLKTPFEEKNSHFNQGCQYKKKIRNFFWKKPIFWVHPYLCSRSQNFFFYKMFIFLQNSYFLNFFILIDAELNQGFSFGNRPSFLRVSRQTVYLCIEVTHRSHLPDPPACIRAW